MRAINSNIDILYVEDNRIDVENVQREFKKVNELLNIAFARNGYEALNKLYGREKEIQIFPAPKIILLDINMPKMNGIEFLKMLRSDAQFNSVIVYVLTASYDTNVKLALSHLNVTGCIVKPLQYADALNIFWTLIKEQD